MMYDNISTPLVQYKAGKVKALAVTSPERHPAAPELPAMSEFYPGFNITSWGGLCGPAGLPPAMVEKAAALTKKALESENLKKTFVQQAATTNWMNPADTAAVPPQAGTGPGADHQGIGGQGGLIALGGPSLRRNPRRGGVASSPTEAPWATILWPLTPPPAARAHSPARLRAGEEGLRHIPSWLTNFVLRYASSASRPPSEP